jgi:adenylate kinase
MSRVMRIILFGAPGVGKGTQAKILSAKLNIPHISTGDILRQATREKTPVGLKVQEMMNRGELVPDDIITAIIKEKLSGEECSNGFILDGFPRTVPQAASLERILLNLGIKDINLIYISAIEDELVKRLTNRRACKVCSNIFNLSVVKDSLVCPVCGAEKSFYQRKDDQEDIIRNRFEVYEKSTKPVLDYYKALLDVIYVNALNSVEEVTESIISQLEAQIGEKLFISA